MDIPVPGGALEEDRDREGSPQEHLAEGVPALTREDVAAEHVEHLEELRDELLAKPGGDVAYDVAKNIRKENERSRNSKTTEPSTQLAQDWRNAIEAEKVVLRAEVVPPSLHRYGWGRGRSHRSFASIYEHFGGENLFDDESESGEEGEEEPLVEGKPIGNSDWATFLTLMKACVGPAHLYLARAIANAGVWSGIIGLTLCCGLNVFCVVLLVEAQKKVRDRKGGGGVSFAQVGREAFGGVWGDRMYWAVEACLVTSQLGIVAMYFIFIGQTVLNVLGAMSNCAAWATGLSLTLLVGLQAAMQMPMSLLRHLHQIAFFAIVADVLILGGMTCVISDNIIALLSTTAAPLTIFRPRTFALFLGTSILTFEGIGLMLPIHDAMINPQNFVWLVILAFFISCAAFIALALTGFMARGGEAVETNLLLSFPPDAILGQIAKILYSGAVILTFPLQAFPAYRIAEIGLGMSSGKHNVAAKWRKNALRLLTVSLLAMTAIAAGPHLDNFVALLGGLTMCPVAFVFPSLFHLKLCAEGSSTRSFVDMALATMGMFIVCFVTYMAIHDWIMSSPEPVPHCEPI
eukprot:Hpha_TRINITY_DN7407_c0_g1::TRINITY_DN7407_c0_g1_i1::g.96003::m.96003/K14209/SLC36A, PAT; solute carrier family 36 (proton-coupled amino acid transporter)